MSAFACILDRRGARVPSNRLERLGVALAIYGGASSSLCAGPIGLVVRHEASSKSRERHGPIRDDRSGLVVSVAGHFSLVDGIGSEGDPSVEGCARWALKRWSRDGSSWLNEIAGSFTIVVADPAKGWLNIIRDHLGDLKVYYHLSERLLIAATEVGAILRGDSIQAEPDESSVARFLGFRFNHTDRSFFHGIRELPPAHHMRVTADYSNVDQYWRIRRHKQHLTAEESRRTFLDHLRRSVRFHSYGLPIERIGLSLSGGLDSTALAAVAPRGIRAYSWFLEATPDPAERDNIEAVARHLDMPIRWINGDEHIPLSGDFRYRFVHDSSPYINAFAELKRQLYATARSNGCQRMMVGDAGDVLYGARAYWLRDALIRRQPWAISSLAWAIKQAVRGDSSSRAALRRLVPIQGIGRALRRRKPPPWLTREGSALLQPGRLSPILPEGSADHRYDLSVGARNIELESEERRLFFQCGVERANPFWYRPLLETVLELPAYRLHRDGLDKVLAREALENLLPVRVLESGRVGLLGDFFLRGIESHREWVAESVFRQPKSDWQRYVRRDWLEPYLEATGTISFGHTILWRTISYELWFRHVWVNNSEGSRETGA